jgi:NAD(P)-dependent dehydrogenase (short-subunit alcohol dehydrogenase family)
MENRNVNLQFPNRVAVVTGGGHGLGRTYARELASRGAIVVINDIGCAADGLSTAESVAGEIASSGGTATAHQGSIADPTAARTLIEETVDRYGRIDILVNNAGFTTMTDFTSHTLADLDHLLDVHLRGPFAATQEPFDIWRETAMGASSLQAPRQAFSVGSEGAGIQSQKRRYWD